MAEFQYEHRDIIGQGEYYLRHVMAMTQEKLHDKSDIAAELAHRDERIAALEVLCRDLEVRLKDALAEIERAQGIGGRLEVERDEAREEAMTLRDAIRSIGDYAHDRSTGPAVPDALWEIRRMAYDELRDAARSAMPGSAPTED